MFRELFHHLMDGVIRPQECADCPNTLTPPSLLRFRCRNSTTLQMRAATEGFRPCAYDVCHAY